jgi:hypothetical protein
MHPRKQNFHLRRSSGRSGKVIDGAMTLRAGRTLAHELANGVEYHVERRVIPPLEAG